MDKLKIPPYNIETEQSIIGGCLIDIVAAKEAVALLKPECFYREEHSIIFKAISKLINENKPVDIVSVRDVIGKNELKDIGGVTYLSRLADSVPNSANVPYYCKIVQDAFVKRNLIKVGGEITELGFQDDDSSKLVHSAKTKLDSLDVSPKIKSVGERMPDILNAIKNRPDDIESPYQSLRSKKIKLHKGDLVLIEAQKKNGKTTFAMNLLYKYIERGYKCLLVTYEIPTDTRYIPMLAKIYKQKVPMDRGEELAQVAEFIAEYGDKLYTLPENATLEEFETSVLLFCKENKIDFFFVDYDQLVIVESYYKTEERRVSAISRTLKKVAMQANCIVILLSQMNDAGEARWSREKENDASVVFRLEKDVLGDIKLWIAYNRYGKVIYKENAIQLNVNWEKRTIREANK